MKNILNTVLRKGVSDVLFKDSVIGVRLGEYSCYSFDDREGCNSSQDLVFDIASITKGFTNTALLGLLLENKVCFDTPIKEYLQIRGLYSEMITFKHLLTFTLGNLLNKSPKGTTSSPHEECLVNGWCSPPGKKFLYSNPPSILAGLLVESISGLALSEYFKKYFFKKVDIRYGLREGMTFSGCQNIAPTEICDFRNGLIQGFIHDETAWKADKYLGHAGLFASAPQLLSFAERFFMGGDLYRLSEIIKQRHLQGLPGTSYGYGLGWDLFSPNYLSGENQEFLGQCFLFTGFTGCIWVVNPEKEFSLVMLTNNIYPKRDQQRKDGLISLRHKLIREVIKNISP